MKQLIKFLSLSLFITFFSCEKGDVTDGTWNNVKYSTLTGNNEILDVNVSSQTTGYNTLVITSNKRATTSTSITYYGVNTEHSTLYSDNNKKNEVGKISKVDSIVVMVIGGVNYTGIVNKYVP